MRALFVSNKVVVGIFIKKLLTISVSKCHDETRESQSRSSK